MLARLVIKNYALIDELEISLAQGLTTITGETGAGKSILLGALSLVLGKRVDLSILKNSDEKCIIEATFSIKAYRLEAFFESNEIDYQAETIMRRELLPSGKSRAFINDTPVNLEVMNALGTRLIDIHSQYETQYVVQQDFQYKVIDAIAGNGNLSKTYREALLNLKREREALKTLIATKEEAAKTYEYKSFILKELKEFKAEEGMQDILESEIENLSNVEAIQEKIAFALQRLSDEEVGIINGINALRQAFDKFGGPFKEIHQHIQSVYAELNDVYKQIQYLEGTLEPDPERLSLLNNRLQQLYNLQTKHRVSSVKELLHLQLELEQSVEHTEHIDTAIALGQAEILNIEQELDLIAQDLYGKRLKVIPELSQKLETILIGVGIPNAKFKIVLSQADDFGPLGKDRLEFLFSANAGTDFGELKKVASGGERSRIVLAIKAILAEYEHLPTIIFDEIDTGVSGEVAIKMATLMAKMALNMQVIAITHLPQIASKGNAQLKVYKEIVDGTTRTKVSALSPQDRITEIAEMLGGKALSESAIEHAKKLLS